MRRPYTRVPVSSAELSVDDVKRTTTRCARYARVSGLSACGVITLLYTACTFLSALMLRLLGTPAHLSSVKLYSEI